MKKRKVCYRKSAMAAIGVLSLSALCNYVQASDNTMLSIKEMKASSVAPISALVVSDDALMGTWTIDRVKVKKTMEGVSSEHTYSLGQKFESFNECPKKVTFLTDGTSVFEYANGKTDGPFEYTVEGNQIKRMIMVAVYTYEYTITDAGELQLVSSISYSRDSKSIEEEYTYYGTKK